MIKYALCAALVMVGCSELQMPTQQLFNSKTMLVDNGTYNSIHSSGYEAISGSEFVHGVFDSAVEFEYGWRVVVDSFSTARIMYPAESGYELLSDIQAVEYKQTSGSDTIIVYDFSKLLRGVYFRVDYRK
jgi:hypothetical protein